MKKIISTLLLALFTLSLTISTAYADKSQDEGKGSSQWQANQDWKVSKKGLRDQKKEINKTYRQAKKDAMTQYKDAKKAAKKLPKDQRKAALEKAKEDKQAALEKAREQKKLAMEQLDKEKDSLKKDKGKTEKSDD